MRVETKVRVVVPRPRIRKRLRLRAVFLTDVVVNLIVIAFGIKRRVNITKVNRFVADEFTQDVEIVAVKEFVHKVYKPNQSRKDLSKLSASVADNVPTVLRTLWNSSNQKTDNERERFHFSRSSA